MTYSPKQPRREFLRQSAQGMALLGTAASVVFHAGSKAIAEPTPIADRPAVFSTGAKRARRIAVGPQDQIYVAADKQILVFDARGQKQQAIPLSRPARCLAVNAQGQLYVGLVDYLQLFDPAGRQIASWQPFSRKTVLSGIAVSERTLFVADAGRRWIWKLDNEGKVQGTIEGKNGFQAPAEFFSINLGANGALHVANASRHRIETYQPDGQFVEAWGRRSRTVEGFGGCCNPVSFVQLPDGNYLTAERGRPRVKLYDQRGEFQKLLAGPESFEINARVSAADHAAGCVTGGLDVAADSTGAAIVLDRVTGHVRRFPVELG